MTLVSSDGLMRLEASEEQNRAKPVQLARRHELTKQVLKTLAARILLLLVGYHSQYPCTDDYHQAD